MQKKNHLLGLAYNRQQSIHPNCIVYTIVRVGCWPNVMVWHVTLLDASLATHFQINSHLSSDASHRFWDVNFHNKMRDSTWGSSWPWVFFTSGSLEVPGTQTTGDYRVCCPKWWPCETTENMKVEKTHQVLEPQCWSLWASLCWSCWMDIVWLFWVKWINYQLKSSYLFFLFFLLLLLLLSVFLVYLDSRLVSEDGLKLII